MTFGQLALVGEGREELEESSPHAEGERLGCVIAILIVVLLIFLVLDNGTKPKRKTNE